MIWVVVFSFVMAFVLAAGLGANDVSNAFATSIGAKILSLSTACLIASIAEFAGSVLLGGTVAENIITGSLKVTELLHSQMMVVMLATLFSVSVWLVLATWLKLPVSATHAVIGSLIGAGMVAKFSSVNFRHLLPMVAAWLIAPLFAGLLALLVYALLALAVLYRQNPFVSGLRAIPFIYTFTLAINCAMIAYQIVEKNCVKPHGVEACLVPISIAASCFVLVALATFLVTRFFVVPWTENSVLRSLERDPNSLQQESKPASTGIERSDSVASSLHSLPDHVNLGMAEQLFASLQIMSAVFTSFAHGSNDVSNSVGPLLWLVRAYRKYSGDDKENSLILYLLLVYGAVGMIVGLYVWGARVIETLGTGLTAMNPSRGFAIELGSAMTVLLASITGWSVSTTHCKVGSIIVIGLYSPRIMLFFEKRRNMLELNSVHGPSKPAPAGNGGKPAGSSAEADPLAKGFNWSLCANIFLSWLCTVPCAMLMSAGLYVGLWWLAGQIDPSSLLR